MEDKNEKSKDAMSGITGNRRNNIHIQHGQEKEAQRRITTER